MPLTEREVKLLLSTLTPQEQAFVQACEQNGVAKPADVAELLASQPPGAPRKHVGSLLLNTGRISHIEFSALMGQTSVPPTARPDAHTIAASQSAPALTPAIAMSAEPAAPPGSSAAKSPVWKRGKTWAVVVLLPSLSALSVYGYQKFRVPEIISYSNAIQYIDHVKTVEGNIESVLRRDSHVYLKFKAFSNSDLNVVIPAKAFGSFPTDFEKLYGGKKIHVTGTISAFKGRLQIIVEHPSQIVVLGQGEIGKEYQHDAGNLIPSQNAHNHIGEIRTVTGGVVMVLKIGPVTCLNLDFDEKGFTVAISADVYGSFPPGFEKLYDGKKIWVTGQISSFRDRTQITVFNPAQIKIVGDGALDEYRPGTHNLISYNNAMEYVGQAKTVEGIIKAVFRPDDKVTILEFSTGSRTDIYIAIFAGYYDNFPKGFDLLYKGKKVHVAGVISTYKGQPQMLIRYPYQIKIVE